MAKLLPVLEKTRKRNKSDNPGMIPDIQTYSGYFFNFLNPDPNTINIVDIAHALSNECRFGGHCKWHYSVAQHSVYVSRLCPLELKFAGLMHDAPEHVVKDMMSPLKMLLPDYKKVEKRVTKIIMNKFGLPELVHPAVKVADIRMLATEKRDIMGPLIDPDNGQWKIVEDVLWAPFSIERMTPEQANLMFLEEYLKLTPFRFTE